MYLLKMFGGSLLLTLILELPIARLMGLRGGKHTVLAVLVNILTNPAAVLLCHLGVSQIPVELAVFAAEAGVYRWFSKDEGWDIPRPVMLAAIANGVSWIGGMIIGGIG